MANQVQVYITNTDQSYYLGHSHTEALIHLKFLWVGYMQHVITSSTTVKGCHLVE